MMENIKKETEGNLVSYDPKLYAALAWLVVPAIIFLADRKYAKDEFLVYNSFMALAYIIIIIGIDAILSALFLYFLKPLFNFVFFIGWIYGIYMAFSGQRPKMPFISDFAEKKAKEHVGANR